MIVVRSRHPPHTLFEALHLTGDEQLGPGELGLVDPLSAGHRLGPAIDDQDVAGVAGQVDAVVPVDQDHQTGFVVMSKLLDSPPLLDLASSDTKPAGDWSSSVGAKTFSTLS